MEGYQVILADPPWEYRSSMVSGSKSSNHYKSMSLKDMESLPVRSWCDNECVLFMWSTGPQVDKAIELGKSWGFEFKQVAFVWNKTLPVPGNYTLTKCEFVLVFRPKRGRLPKRAKTNVHQYFECVRREHSRKPEYVQDMIDLMYPGVKKLEMFSRRWRPGWDSWGDETEKFNERR